VGFVWYGQLPAIEQLPVYEATEIISP
jgi:hypothetical protein